MMVVEAMHNVYICLSFLGYRSLCFVLVSLVASLTGRLDSKARHCRRIYRTCRRISPTANDS